MKKFLVLAVLVSWLMAAPAYPGEIIIWYDEQGVAHKALSPQEIPARHRPQAQGIITTLTPETVEEAAYEGMDLVKEPMLYRDGLGLFQPFTYEHDMEENTGYFFVGTKYNLIKARAAAEAAREGYVSAEFIHAVRESSSLPVGFYSWNFEPVLLMLIQDGKFIKGDDGFEKGTDPQLKVPAFVKNFPYEALDFSRPVQIQVYSREGNVVQLKVELTAFR